MNIIKQIKDENGNNIYPIGYAQGGMKMDLLWTNPSPTSSFSAQTISLDLSSYKYVHIIFRWNNQYADQIQKTTMIGYGDIVVGYDSTTIGRKYSVNTSGVVIGSGNCIPLYIYGIKMSYIVPTSVHGLQYVEV